MKILKEFKEFAIRGNVVDMGVGIVIGAAFTSVVNSLVKDVFSPFLAMLTTNVNFANWYITLKNGVKGGPYETLTQAQADNAITINVGSFLNAMISFLIVAVVLYFLVRSINRLKRPEKVTVDPVKTKECPFCYSVISIKASRCPFCTSQVDAE
jgi:large conductance mechanosensitive channel